jgi:hypothetical protein
MKTGIMWKKVDTLFCTVHATNDWGTLPVIVESIESPVVHMERPKSTELITNMITVYGSAMRWPSVR